MNKLTRNQLLVRTTVLLAMILALLSVAFLADREIMLNILGGVSLWSGLSYWIYAERAPDPATKKAALIVAGMAGALSVLLLTLRLRGYTADLFITAYQLAGALVFVRMAVLFYQNMVVVFTALPRNPLPILFFRPPVDVAKTPIEREQP